MEARISSSADDAGSHTPLNSLPAHHHSPHSLPSHSKKEVATITTSASTTPSRRRAKTEVKKSANSAAAKAKEAKEKAAQQWQRRKNYDPLKSMAKAKVASSRNEYTDESSDVESAASMSQRGGPTNPRVALIRSDAGRHSLRQQQHGGMGVKDDGPQSLGSPVRRPPFRTNVMSQNGGRSTSSLSSKEAEFQVRKENLLLTASLWK